MERAGAGFLAPSEATINGGPGDDVYYIHNSQDVVVEAANAGHDTIFTSVSYGLAAGSHVEVLSTIDHSSTIAIDLSGNEFANTLYGNAGNNVLNGRGGADILIGLGGNDTYYLDDAGDFIVEGAGQGQDTAFTSVSYTLGGDAQIEVLSTIDHGATTAINLTGNGFGNTIYGNAGANTLNGGGGADFLIGLGGNDIYYVDNAADYIVEGSDQGNDTLFTSVNYTLTGDAHVEVLSTIDHASLAALSLTGNQFANTLYGNAGANTLNGGGGADFLIGFGGNDIYYVDNAADYIVEAAGQGNDTLFTSVNYTLTGDAHVEVLSTIDHASLAALSLTGNIFANTLYGNAGANTLNGGGGADTLIGFGGNDTYYVDNASDFVVEGAAQGQDTVFTSVSYALGGDAQVEVLSAIDNGGTSALSLTGNGFANVIYGNAGGNVLNGGGGADTLIGFAGNDTYYVDHAGDVVVEALGEGQDAVFSTTSYALAAGQHVEVLSAADNGASVALNLTGNELANSIFGNAGANILNGGAGTDTLQGFAGADTFAFTTGLNAGNVDTVADFQVGVDRLSLGGANGEPFALLATGSLGVGAFRVGGTALDADDRILYNQATGALLYDADGAGGAAAVHFATLSAGLALTAADFIVTGPANTLPVMSSGTTAAVQENIATTTVVYQAVAQDADGDSIAFVLSGTDASRFTIDQTGAVRFINSPDFETQSSYSFTVSALDSSGAGSARTVTLTITDQNENPGGGPYVVTDTGINDTISTAQPLDRNQFRVVTDANVPDDDLPSARIEGSISTSGDRDFFTITLQAGELLILDVDGTTNGLDALMRVYGPNGAEIVMNDDRVSGDPGSTIDPTVGHNLDSFIQFRPSTSGTYTFSIESWQQQSSGSYVIHASLGPIATPAQIQEENIQSLISGSRWNTTNVTFGFTTDPSQYGSNEGVEEKVIGFEALNSTQQGVVRQILSRISGVVNLTFTEAANPATAQMRYAMSDDPNTAHAYYPGTGNGGDSWYNNNGPLNEETGVRGAPRYDNPVVGDYAYFTFLHETGHALGLKHGHEAPALSPDRDSMEYSIMTYRGYIGAPSEGGYKNEVWGFAQTLMMYDIAALQRIYGANFSTQAGDTVYTWSPTSGQTFINGGAFLTPGGNRIFMTVWDGGGNDTYNLSNYSNAVTIDLRPGEWTITSQVQLANLGNSNFARGNVANSLLYNNDTRSLIENAIGGSGNDILVANQATNRLTGGAGTDTFRFHSTGDSGLGGLADLLTDFVSGSDRIDLSSIDANVNASGDQAFSFIGSNAFTGVAGQLRYEVEGNNVRILADVDGNGVADMSILATTPTIVASDFIL